VLVLIFSLSLIAPLKPLVSASFGNHNASLPHDEVPSAFCSYSRTCRGAFDQHL
jgi:hypothetical protein